jgi:glycosyltransferase involved in cell wall biosynthesis
MLLVLRVQVKYPMMRGNREWWGVQGGLFDPPDPLVSNFIGSVMVTIVHLITGLETGGAERMLSRLVRRIDRDRFRSVVVSITDAGTLGRSLGKAGVEVMSIEMRRGMPDPYGLFRLACILRGLRPDILQTWLYHADFFGLMVKRMANVPHLLWNLRCSDMALSPAAAGVRRLLSWCSALPDAVIVNSLAGRSFHERIGYHPRRWEYVPNGFDTIEFSPNAEARKRLRSELEIPEDAIVIGLPARYHPMKDHGTFLEAAAGVAAGRPEVRFLLVGPGTEPTNPALAKAIARLGLAGRTRLLGERSDMPAVYAALDIATLSSAWGEGFPNVLGEAMACGLPCVATDGGDARGLLGDTGLVVPRRDPEAMAGAWQAMIAIGAEGRRARGGKARERIVRDYDLGGIARRYEALYADIAARDVPSRIPPRSAAPSGRQSLAARPAQRRDVARR